jgi:hypothetical protein
VASKEQTHSNDKASPKQRLPKPATESLDVLAQQQTHPATIIQRARRDPRSLTPRDVLQLQRTIGNQAVGPFLTGRVQRQPTQTNQRVVQLKTSAQVGDSAVTWLSAVSKPAIQLYRDFERANGKSMYDYKIVNGTDLKYGQYHIKFHKFQGLEVFNEIHIVFEKYDRKGYFFYTDQGDIIEEKSSGLNLKDSKLTERAQELILKQLETSDVVDNQVVQELITKKQKREERDRQQRGAWEKERTEKEAVEKEGRIQAELKRLSEEYSIAALLHNKGLLRPIVESGIQYMMFIKFTVKDPINKWPSTLQNLSGPILETVHDINLDERVTNAYSLTALQRGYLIQIMIANKDNDYVPLPSQIFTAGENPVLNYDEEDKEYDIFYDAISF